MINRTCRPLKAAEYSRFCTRGTSKDLSHLRHSARAPLTGNDGCYLSQNASRRGRLRWLAHLSSGFVFAEAASRGVRYDKYFAIGKFSRHIFNRRLLSAMRAENKFGIAQLFSCISPRDNVLVFRNKFSETITCRPILSVGRELSDGLLSTTCHLSTLHALKVLEILSVKRSLVQSACNCRHTICSSVLQTKYVWTRHRSAGAGEEGAKYRPFLNSPCLSASSDLELAVS